MGGDDNGFPGIQQACPVVDDNFRFAVNHLDKRVKRGYLFSHGLACIERNHADIAGGLPENCFDHYRVGNILKNFNNNKDF